MTRIVAVGVVVFALSACGKSEGTSDKKGEAPAAAQAAPADGFTEVPNVSGLAAKIPATLVPNGLGGAAGFHAKEGKLSIQIRELTGDEGKASFDEAKKTNEELLFKKWISAQKTADGWVMLWEGDTSEGLGASHNFEVKKTVGTKSYKCYGSAASAADINQGADVCKSLKAR